MTVIRYKMKAIICIALMAPTITAASAAEKDLSSANFFIPYCRLTSKEALASATDAFYQGQCFGMVRAIRAAAEAMRTQQALCTDIPGNVTLQQLVNAVVRYGEAHPDQAQQGFEAFTFRAIRDAWPCPK
jgi:Rap1a immunity proteins